MSGAIESRPEVPARREQRLRVSEIFHSLQGEARDVGWPTVFVRLTGCPLRCVWCDTEYAFHGGQWHAIDDIVENVAKYETRHVCVTGGEPLAQKRCLDLLEALCDAGYEVSLETSGALDVSGVDRRVSKVMDLKAPGSGDQRATCGATWPALRRTIRSSSCSATAPTMTGPAPRCGNTPSPTLRGAVLAGLWPAAGARTGRMDPRRPPAGAHATAIAQAAVGRGAGALSMENRAVVLVSGGMDSAVTLAIARAQGFALPRAQRRLRPAPHLRTRAAAERAPRSARSSTRPCRGSAQHRRLGADRRHRCARASGGADGIPVTYVPARNTIMLSIALGWAEVLGADDIFCGVNAVDYSGYPDCRPEFIAEFERARQPGDEGRRRRRTPAHPGAADPDEQGRDRACRHAPRCRFLADRILLPGRCRRPRLRPLRRLPARAGFPHAGVPDPTRYRG